MGASLKHIKIGPPPACFSPDDDPLLSQPLTAEEMQDYWDSQESK